MHAALRLCLALSLFEACRADNGPLGETNVPALAGVAHDPTLATGRIGRGGRLKSKGGEPNTELRELFRGRFKEAVVGPKVALITGITGQDGSYLAELLLSLGYVVHGILRRSSSFNAQRIVGSLSRLHLHYGDLADAQNLYAIVAKVRPDEIYNLAAQSHVMTSFEVSLYTGDVDGLGVLRILNAIVENGLSNKTKFYQASTSELYGKVVETPQSEVTPFHPRSPYGVAKLYGFWIVVNYREAYGVHASNGILFNHESPRRGPTFITRKVTRAVARIARGLQSCLYLGNINSQRDWGHARDYVHGMYLMLQQEVPSDYVLATGRTTSVRLFVEAAFRVVGITIGWVGSGVNEVGYVVGEATQRVLVRIDPKYYRPAEVDLLLGDPSKAKVQLGWTAQTSLDMLCDEMVKADLALADDPHDEMSKPDATIAAQKRNASSTRPALARARERYQHPEGKKKGAAKSG